MRRLIAAAAALLVVTGLGFAIWVRVAPSDPAEWHVDPLTAPGTGWPNAWRVGPEGAPVDAVAPVYPVTAAELAAAVDAHALAQPDTIRLAGDPATLWTTYVQRSKRMKFPDYISVRAIDLGDGRSTVAIYSRARFGRGDLGVNRARVENWLAALAPLAQ